VKEEKVVHVFLILLCCSVLQCVAVCCIVLQCARGAAPCSPHFFVLQCVAVCERSYIYPSFLRSCVLMHAPQHSAKLCNILQHTAAQCNTVQHNATQCKTQYIVFYYSTRVIQVLATHCNTLQHTASHCNTHYNSLLLHEAL